MPHQVPGEKLTALIVTPDRSMMRLTSRFLRAFGYETLEAAEVSTALTAMECRYPEFVLIDEQMKADGAFELCDLAGTGQRPQFFLLVDHPDTRILTEALSAGVDDFLIKPLIHGELLARLRAGAKSLEYDRRAAHQRVIDSETDLPNQLAMLDHFNEQLAQSTEKPTACIVLDIDFFLRVVQTHSQVDGNNLIRELGRRLQESLDSDGFVARIENNRFGIILNEVFLDEAVSTANRIRCLVSETEWSCGGDAISLTASCGVAIADEHNCDRHEVLKQANTALGQAKSSGRNCVVSFGDFSGEESAWSDLAAPGRLFEQTLARDIMTPCTSALRQNDSIKTAEQLFRQTRLTILPVIGPDGKLAGCVRHEAVRDIQGTSKFAEDSPRFVEEVIDYKAAALDEESAFAKVTEHFTGDVIPVLFITRNGRPTGYVTREILASLSQPVHRKSYSTSQPLTSSTSYLLVSN